MKRFSPIMALACILAVSSCMDLNFDPDELVQESAFAKKVGGIDKEQTWNLATTKSVTVTGTGAPVRVYASDGSRRVLVAENKISGTKTINFDAVSGVKDVLVMNMAGGQVLTAPVGGTVSFATTKATYAGDANVSAQVVDEYKEFTYSVVESDVHTDAFKDVESSAPLFYSESGTFTLNPAWYTCETTLTGWAATFGIYYYDGSGNRVDVPVYKNDHMDTYGQADNMVMMGVDWGSGWRRATEDLPAFSTGPDFTGTYKSKGILVNVPPKTAFGLFISVGSPAYGGQFFSESQYNYETVPSENPGPYIGPELGKYGHFSIIEVDGRKYLACDDWCEINSATTIHSLDHPEYHHLVFSVEGDLTDKIGGDPVGEDGAWILACEDLGEDADIDFNDVVFSVTHMADATKAQVTVLAAGGTLPSNIYYNDQDLGEVHELFGESTTTIINTFIGKGMQKAPVSFEIDVPANFTMSDTDMGGFSVRCGGTSSVIAAPGKGSVPYMICVPANWDWPGEMISITDAYPDFSAWCNDHTQHQDWYLNPVPEKVHH